MSGPLPMDAADRSRALEALGSNLVVEAGAGTGKTTLLIGRILALLEGRPDREALPMDSLVVLTFTEKAAGELKWRLADELSKIAAAGAPAWAQKALEELEKAQIGTIHSFAAHLLRLYPVEAGVDPDFTVDEGDFFDELFEAEWSRWLDRELGEAAPRPQAWLDILALASLEDLEILARELSSEGLDLSLVGKPQKRVAAWLEEAAEALSGMASRNPLPHRSSKIAESLGDLTGRLRALAEAHRGPSPAALKPPDSRPLGKSAWPKNWDHAGQALYERARKIAERTSPQEEALVRRACALVEPFASALRREYRRRGFISFDGLLRWARDLVRDRLPVREELKKRYKALLIDEFQDTDPLQGEILLFLAEAEGRAARRWEDVELGPGRLFVVGDPKQSIYRFRGADIAAYQRFTERVLSGPMALSCDLQANFRSDLGLLEPVNAIFERIMRYEPGLQPPYKKLSAAKKPGPAAAAGPGLELICVAAADGRDKELAAEAVQRREAEWMADWIMESRGHGRRYRDVAILLRSAAPLEVLLDVFKGKNIPYAVEFEKYFYGTQEICDFLNLLRVLDNPEDRVSLAGLLRSALGGLEDRELYELARAGGLSYLKDPPASLERSRGRLGRLFKQLRDLRSQVGRRPLSEFVPLVLEKTFLLELASRAYHGQQTVSNLLKISRLASSANEERAMTLREFIELLGRHVHDLRKEGESPLADESFDAVRLMSIHKSKGLEFPVVFLANASGAPGGQSKRALSLTDWSAAVVGLRLPKLKAADASMAWLEVQEDIRQEHEALRLLYVALTRAKEKLFILGKVKPSGKSLSEILARAGAWPSEAGEDEAPAPSLGLPVRWIRAETDGAASSPERAMLSPGLSPTNFPSKTDADSWAAAWAERKIRRSQARSLPWTLSPSKLPRNEESGYASPNPLPSGPAIGTAALLGRICHKVLEQWDFRGSGPPLEELVAKTTLAVGRGSPGRHFKALGREAHGILSAFMGSDAARELARAEILGREIPFVYAQEGAVVRGVMDLVYRLGGEVVVVDYKTERAAPGREAALSLKYERQGAAYRAAVEKALGVKARFRLIPLRL
ncbi:MAG: UvrD-helicase domain-containing protein [Elusimicrobia bacterium]|nr:UvrD-helicase domain-containing protein [Elusimicrobiota bacterium]